MTKTYLWVLFPKTQNTYHKYISLQFPTEMNTRGSKTASFLIVFVHSYDYSSILFHFPDITSLLCSSADTELDLGCGVLGYKHKHDSRWKSWKMTDRKTMLAIAFLRHTCFGSYYRVGLGVVQLVRYFKTSRSIRLIAPLNGHFKSELRWHTKPTSHKTYHRYVHLFQGKNWTLLFTGTQWTFHIEYVTKHTWQYVVRVLRKITKRYIFIMRPRYADLLLKKHFRSMLKAVVLLNFFPVNHDTFFMIFWWIDSSIEEAFIWNRNLL